MPWCVTVTFLHFAALTTDKCRRWPAQRRFETAIFKKDQQSPVQRNCDGADQTTRKTACFSLFISMMFACVRHATCSLLLQVQAVRFPSDSARCAAARGKKFCLVACVDGVLDEVLN